MKNHSMNKFFEQQVQFHKQQADLDLKKAKTWLVITIAVVLVLLTALTLSL